MDMGFSEDDFLAMDKASQKCTHEGHCVFRFREAEMYFDITEEHGRLAIEYMALKSEKASKLTDDWICGTPFINWALDASLEELKREVRILKGDQDGR